MKIGGFCVLIDKETYGSFGYNCEQNSDALMKVINLDNKNHLGEIEKIMEGDNIDSNLFMYIPKIYDELCKIDEYSELFNYIKNYEFDYEEDNPKIFGNNDNLYYYYIENCGSSDMHNIVNDIYTNTNNMFEKNTKSKFSIFVKAMLRALYYMKESKLGHFDIKPENIIYNENIEPFKFRFKLIDF